MVKGSGLIATVSYKATKSRFPAKPNLFHYVKRCSGTANRISQEKKNYDLPV